MSEPPVCAIMLTKDRPEMAARAVRAFRAQTYPRKRLLVWDSGAVPASVSNISLSETLVATASLGLPIGTLRNFANQYASKDWAENPEIFIHFDDDDYSHPNRIAEQVAHLQSSGADAVGYNELLFWDSRIVGRIASDAVRITEHGIEADVDVTNGEAWIYKNAGIFPPPGTSLCYWRRTWERKPFGDFPKARGGTGEDYQWCKGLNVATMSSLIGWEPDPRMIASIHGGNTMPYDIEGEIERGAHTNWKRLPQRDDYARKVMALWS